MNIFSRLFTLPENLYSSGAPVMIAAGALLKEMHSGKVMAQLKFRSIENKIINSVTVKLYPLDANGNKSGDTDFTYTGLSITRDMEFGKKTPVFFPDISVASYSVSVTEVVFMDNSVWNGSAEPWTSLGKPELLTDRFDADFAQFYTEASGGRYKYVYKKAEDLWLCPCGTWNRASEPSCVDCHSGASGFERQDLCAMQQNYHEGQRKQIAFENRQKLYRREKLKKWLIFPALLLLLIAAAIIVIVVVQSSFQSEKALPSGSESEAQSSNHGSAKEFEWSLKKGNLDLSGSGDMPDYEFDRERKMCTAPWGKNADLIETITVQSGISSIGDNAFRSCSNLTSVIIPQSVRSIGDNAFSYCTSLRSIYLPNSVTKIEQYAFKDCTSLSSLTLSENLKSIGSYSFFECVNLRSVTIPESVSSIGKFAFGGCTRLTSVIILSSVSSIGKDAFYQCPNLTICAPSGSYAEQYAKENHIPFVSEPFAVK